MVMKLQVFGLRNFISNNKDLNKDGYVDIFTKTIYNEKWRK